ncbi:MAG: hypothetical protein PHQ50_01920 [Eubacteriales bacterium]|nr:hypothetical protein [Eubacteriales bacterium]MDD3350578.1 hypothetical protein [Eubacteriales bacterium]
MICGVKFCGGCNPRYERGEALEKIRSHFKDKIEFHYAEENVPYDCLLVIGGCTNCCASHCQYDVKQDCVRMWDESHIEDIVKKLESMISG